MKLYFYFLEKPSREEPRIRFEECEVRERPQSYKLIGDKYIPISGFYRNVVNKGEIGRLLEGHIVVLGKNEPEVALELFENRINEQIEELKTKLKAIEKWRLEHESNS